MNIIRLGTLATSVAVGAMLYASVSVAQQYDSICEGIKQNILTHQKAAHNSTNDHVIMNNNINMLKWMIMNIDRDCEEDLFSILNNRVDVNGYTIYHERPQDISEVIKELQNKE